MTTTTRTRFFAASMLVGLSAAVLWLHAPVLPSVIGALGAGAILYLRNRENL